jgi:hypothetical protein
MDDNKSTDFTYLRPVSLRLLFVPPPATGRVSRSDISMLTSLHAHIQPEVAAEAFATARRVLFKEEFERLVRDNEIN